LRQNLNIWLIFVSQIVGQYGPLGSKTLVIRDLEIAKHILVKDFDYFIDRRPFDLSKKANKYFSGMLTTLTGEKWKTMRGIMSPVFTSGKLKSMMPIIHKVRIFMITFLKHYRISKKRNNGERILEHSKFCDVIYGEPFRSEAANYFGFAGHI